jgi:flagellar protein FlgJ
MQVGLSGFSNITSGYGALQSAKMNSDGAKFSELLNRLQNKSENVDKSTLSSSQIIDEGRLNGEYTTGFAGTYSNQNDKAAMPVGAAANQANPNVKTQKIDKTSKLYEKAMELESFFIKQMLSSMRKTVNKASLGNNDFAANMYEDMLYDEYATSMTKNAGFGLADQIYMQLS